MNKPKVSVIIPVYNTEDYVQECIKSICNQSLNEIEIIAINDGSTDNSLTILKEYAKKDSRIKVHSQTNRGLSSTRNIGMELAEGEYIYFMDSDDLLHPEALDICYQKSKKENLDFVFFDGETFCEGTIFNQPIFNYQHTNGLADKIYKGVDIFEILINKNQYTPSVCLNFINKEFVSKFNLKFYPNILHEDQLFTCIMYMYAERVGFIPLIFFYRRVHSDSIMTRRFAWRNIQSYFIVADELIDFSKTKSIQIQTNIKKLLNQMLNAAVWQAYIMSFKERLKLFHICLTKYKNYINIRTLGVLIFKKNIHSK